MWFRAGLLTWAIQSKFSSYGFWNIKMQCFSLATILGDFFSELDSFLVIFQEKFFKNVFFLLKLLTKTSIALNEGTEWSWIFHLSTKSHKRTRCQTHTLLVNRTTVHSKNGGLMAKQQIRDTNIDNGTRVYTYAVFFGMKLNSSN